MQGPLESAIDSEQLIERMTSQSGGPLTLFMQQSHLAYMLGESSFKIARLAAKCL
jgi:hypothetical protein